MQLIQPSTTLEMKNILTASFIAVVLALATQSPEVNAASIGVNTENVLAERGPAKYCTASNQCNVAAGHFCDHKRCRKRRPNGSGCYKDVGCISGLCWKERGTCISAVKPRPLQAPCTASSQCDSKYCGYSRCAKKVKNNKKCYKDAGCKSGKCDKALKKCVPVTAPTSTLVPTPSEALTSTDKAATTTAPTTAVEDPTTSAEPTSAQPSSSDPSSVGPTSSEPTSAEPTSAEPGVEPTSAEPTSAEPTGAEPSAEPTSAEPTSVEPTSAEPTSAETTSAEPTSAEPTSAESTAESTTAGQATVEPTTVLEPTTISTSEPEEPTAVTSIVDPEPTTVVTIVDSEPITLSAEPMPTDATTDATTEILPTSTVEATTTDEPTTTAPIETVAPTTSAGETTLDATTTAEITTTTAPQDPVSTADATTTAEATTTAVTEEPTSTTATEEPTTTAAPEATTTAVPTTTDQSAPLSTQIVLPTTVIPAAPEATVQLVLNGDFSRSFFPFSDEELFPFHETVSDAEVGGSVTVAQINDNQRAADLRVFNDGNTAGLVYPGEILLGKRLVPEEPATTTATEITLTADPTTTAATEEATVTEAATTLDATTTTTQDAAATTTATHTGVDEGSIIDSSDSSSTTGHRTVTPSVSDPDNAWKYDMSYDWLFYNGTGPVETDFGPRCLFKTAIGGDSELSSAPTNFIFWFFYKNEDLSYSNVWRSTSRYYVSSVANPSFRIWLDCQQMSGAAYVRNIGFNERVTKYDLTTGGYIADGGFETSYAGWSTIAVDPLGQQTFEGTSIVSDAVVQPSAGELAAMLSAHDGSVTRIQQSFMLPHVEDDSESYKFSLKYQVRQITPAESTYNTDPSQFDSDLSSCRLTAKLRNNQWTATVEDSREHWVQWTPSQLNAGSEDEEWKTLSFNVPSNMAMADISFYCTAATMGEVYLDEVSLERNLQND